MGLGASALSPKIGDDRIQESISVCQSITLGWNFDPAKGKVQCTSWPDFFRLLSSWQGWSRWRARMR